VVLDHAGHRRLLGRCGTAAASIEARFLSLEGARAAATIFGDMIGKLDVLRVACEKCDGAGRYQVDRVIDERDRDAKVIDCLAEITADCPTNRAHKSNDQCGTRYQYLLRAL
jgi:hypothetical protein